MACHHGNPSTTPTSRLRVALVAVLVYMCVEVAAGLWTGSLALLADAGHMLSDAGALAIALAAARLAQRPPDPQRTLGWGRAEVLGATINAALLLALSLFIVVEALSRLGSPHEIAAIPMMVVAGLGLLLNIAIASFLWEHHDHDLNLRAAFLHVVGDILGSLGALLAGGAVLAWGWTAADSVASILIAVLLFIGAVRILRETTDILMLSIPAGIRLDDVRATLLAQPGVSSIHDLHLWSITPGSNVLSVHVVTDSEVTPQDAQTRLQSILRDTVPLAHLTIQVEVGDDQCSHPHS